MTLSTEEEKAWEAGRKTDTLEKRARRKYCVFRSRSFVRTCSDLSVRAGEDTYLG